MEGEGAQPTSGGGGLCWDAFCLLEGFGNRLCKQLGVACWSSLLFALHPCACQDLTPDYSMESHQRDHENYVACSRNRRRRAKALLDFERHDDDELGFRKNDIITVRGAARGTPSPSGRSAQGSRGSEGSSGWLWDEAGCEYGFLGLSQHNCKGPFLAAVQQSQSLSWSQFITSHQAVVRL